MNGLRLSASIIVLAMVAPYPAHAQDTATASPDDSTASSWVSDIVVTAQRREQSLQSVPIAISALSGESLQERQITSVERLTGLAPNLQVTKAPTNATTTIITIRGSGTQNPGILFDPAVGLYMDGVYVGKAAGSVFDNSDLERVEVLRGPQGTLYGRNTLAGAINLVTRKPGPEGRTEAEASYGNYDYYSLRGLVNVPLTETLFFKVSAQLRKREGFTRLVPDPRGIYTANSRTGTLDTLNRQSLLAQVRWLPTETMTIDYSYDYSRVKESMFTGLYAVTPGGLLDNPAIPNFYISPYIPNNPVNRPDTVSNNNRSRQFTRVQGHSLTIAQDLGDLTVKSITAFRKFFDSQLAPDKDTDGTPVYALANPSANNGIVQGGQIQTYKQFSQELQLQGKLLDDRLNFTTGLYFFKDDAEAYNPQVYFLGNSAFETRFGGQTKSLAAFGQADYKITEQLTVTGGLRYTWERKRVQRFYRTTAGTPTVPDFEITSADDVHAKFERFTPTVILAYQVTPRINIYGSYSQGYRSGGFNGEATRRELVASPYKPEINSAFELGLKSQVFDRRLQFNAAAFYEKQTNKQLSVFAATGSASSFIQNAGKAKVKGFEVELIARPVDVLTLSASYGYTRQKYTEYTDIDRTGPVPVEVDVSDLRVFSRAPETTFNLNADVEVYRGLGEIHLAGDLNYVDNYYSLVGTRRRLPGSTGVPDPRFPAVIEANSVIIPAVTTIDARLMWRDLPVGQTRLSAMLFVRNLTNEKKVVNKINFGPNFGGFTNANYMDSRTYGITVGVKF